MDINIGFFVSCDQIQKVFDPKRTKIKMSSLLNVSNDSNKPEEFNLKDIEVFVDSEEQNWFKRVHLGKLLGIEDVRTSLNGLERREILTRQELVPTRRGTPIGLDLKISKTRQINSSHPLGLCMSL